MAKPFTWSYSKAKSFMTCPKKHYEVDLAKNFSDVSEALTWGGDVHKSLAAAVLYRAGLPPVGNGRDKIEPAPLPDSMRDYQKWVEVACAGGPVETLYVEQKYAITKQFQPTAWFGNDVWFRGVCDLLAINKNMYTATALDWKTGKIQHDSRQLMLMSQCIFTHHPEVDTIKTRFVWLKDGCTTAEVFYRETIMKEWPKILDVVNEMEIAATTMNYPPKPSGLCARHCPVVSCQYHGKRTHG